jgi:ribosomal-protein-alanine N-acetyltransferase
MIVIETGRLLLRHWSETDYEPYAGMNMSPAVRRYFPGLQTPEESRREARRQEQDLCARGYGRFATEVKETGAFIGYIGLSLATFPSHFTPCVEIGWRLDEAAWGRGYATEGARACLQAAFERWNLPEIYSWTSVHNKPSERVMIRLGMTRIGTFRHTALPEGHWLSEHVLYKIHPPHER